MDHSEMKATYERLWSQGIQGIQEQALRGDPHLFNKACDHRKGLTLICRPSPQIQETVIAFLKEAYQLEPEQYFYQASELHTTVLAIMTCHVDFNVSKGDVGSYIEVLETAVQDLRRFNIAYRGITASPDSVMIQGFPQDATLALIRENIRTRFKKYNLKSTLDERYSAHTAHMTCLRFKTAQLDNGSQFLRLLKQYRAFDFGTSPITELELVVNDWYMSVDKTEVLHTLSLT
ncbi:2'-5' RNA ligase [Pullulanibacillus pueri]|uniref:A-kinase anchor protein 7-like phosphoesterase domain-containing protein n=1 Tax=Pullulanibacillus pueri TaxID=1437324 RepID=A0A8J2ZQK5_9BACL|nr:hypothetical protein [Pullulanibacillus pueri]MBM7679904.1 2'-5' RNA ligase [Pullulanibacillus pueri]GGH73414.1 hypothetical protein GCM10007096_00620 [Pullulanibacillus pueri]